MKKLVLISIFSAIAIALGLLFISIPNLEFVTTTFFLAGYFLGSRDGVISAVLGEFIYSLLNPIGSASPPLLSAQIVGMGIVAFTGGMVAKTSFFASGLGNQSEPTDQFTKKKKMVKSDKGKKIQQTIFLGSIGFVLTLAFDTLTTISFLLFAGLTFSKFLVSLVYGLYFYLIHIGMNTLIFALIMPILIPLFKNRMSGYAAL